MSPSSARATRSTSRPLCRRRCRRRLRLASSPTEPSRRWLRSRCARSRREAHTPAGLQPPRSKKRRREDAP
eukprot:433659-Prymnesium_polylepis.1